MHMTEFYKKNKQVVNIFTIIIVVWIGSWILVDCLTVDGPNGNRGVFGDKFGFVNSLFSGLALGGVVYSILLQQKELSLQRKELSETREEFKDQNFQTTFFNILKTQRQIIDELTISIPYLAKGFKKTISEVKGRKFFISCKSEMKRIISALEVDEFKIYNVEEVDLFVENIDSYEEPELIEERVSDILLISSKQYLLEKYEINSNDFDTYKAYNNEQIEARIVFIYQKFFNKHSYAIGHYFRHVYHILLFIKNSEEAKIKLINKDEFTDENYINKVNDIENEYLGFAQFIKAQMDTPELFTLFYNSFSYPKAKELLIKYKMLDTLHEENLLQKEHNIIAEYNLLKNIT